jgi:uncharacterized membrane protein
VRRSEKIRAALEARFPRTWWVFYYGLEDTLRKAAGVLGGLSLGMAVYLALSDRGYLSVPFWFSCAVFMASAGFLQKADRIVSDIYDRDGE